MKLKKIFASAVAAVAAITSVASLASCKKDDDVTDDGGNDQGGNENDAAAEIQAKLEAAINGLSVKSSYEADFTLTTTAAGGVTISWASNNVDVVKIENGKATVTRPGLTEADATVKITATAVIDGETKIKEFTITIPHVADQSKTIAAIKELEHGTDTAAKGIVTGFVYAENDIKVKSGFYLTDSTGTIYVFGKNVAAELSIGDEVYFDGEFQTYFGSPQLAYPENVVKLGEGKTANFTTVISDKTVTDIVTSEVPSGEQTTTPTTIHMNVYDMIVYFEKVAADTYVNYRVCDPENKDNYMNIYFKSTVVPTETYDFTEEYNSYAGKYVRVKFIVNGTSSKGKWRGHILDFTPLTEAESAKMLLLEATEDIPAVVPVTTPTTEIELPAVTLPTGATLEVTSTCTNVSYADGKITITKPAEDTTAEIKFVIKSGETILAEYTKSVELKVGATDITSLVTIADGKITIPYSAIKYAGEHIIDLGDGKKLTVNYGTYVDKSSFKEVGLAKSGVITFTAEGFKLDALISDVYGTYDNMACYVGTDATGTAITATKGKGQGTTYTYEFAEATNDIYYVNTSTEHDVAFFGLELVLEGSLDAIKAEEEANRLAGLISSLYEATTTVDLSSTAGTVVITPQAGATTLSVNGTSLTVTPGATEVTETITIKVTVGEAEFTTEAINVKSKAFAVEAGSFSTTLGNPESSISSDKVNETTDYAEVLGLRDMLFNVSCAKNDGSTMTYLQYTETRLYWDTSKNGNGSTIKVAVENLDAYNISISSIVVKYSGADNTGTVTANEKVITGTANDLDYTYEFEGVNEFVIQNTNTTNVQVKIKSIVINYTVTEKEPVEYTVDLSKTEFNLKDEATMPTVEYDVYASVWGGTEPTGTFIPVDADGKFDVVGSFTGVTLVLIKKGQEAAWSGDNFLAQTIDYTVEGTTVLAPFDGTEDYVEYTLDLSKIQYNLSTETTLPAEYDVYVTVWGGTEPAGGLVQVDAEGKFKVLGTFTNATVLLIVKGETPAWEGAAFIAKTKDYTLTDTTIAGPFDGTEVAVEYTVDLSATKYNLKNDATMPTVEYDVYATVWGGTATSGTFIPVTLNGSFEVLGTFTNASLILIAKDQTPAWSGDNFLGQTTDYTVNETTLVAPINPVDITSKVTINEGYISIPHDAITADGLYFITIDTDKVVYVEWTGFVDKSKHSEIGLSAGNAVKITAEGVKLDALISDVYGNYNNMKCYVGSDNTGTEIKPTTGKGSGIEYTYLLDAVESVYFANSSTYEVAFYDLQLVIENYYVAPTVVEASIEEANEIGLNAYAKNGSTTQTYKTTGVITEIKSATYGNLYISDGINTIYVYGLNDSEGNSYGEMATKPVVGDTIVIEGSLTQFSGASQFKSATLVSCTTDAAAYNEVLAISELNRLVALIKDSYVTTATIDLSSEIAEVAVEITTTETTSLVWDATTKTLTITPTETAVNEALTISVTVGEQTKTDNTITFVSQLDANPAVLAATFTLGTDSSADESTNAADGSSKTTYTETVGNYTLTLENGVKFYTGSNDNTGQACLKLGTSSAAGSFSFTVAKDVKKVVIYVAGYKAKDAKIKINDGDVQTITTYSNVGEYTAVEIDTTTNKTVTFTTASGGYRCKINTIEFYA